VVGSDPIVALPTTDHDEPSTDVDAVTTEPVLESFTHRGAVPDVPTWADEPPAAVRYCSATPFPGVT
jgi:hypothetical protein